VNVKSGQGGAFYDAIHAETARKMECSKIHTLNENHSDFNPNPAIKKSRFAREG